MAFAKTIFRFFCILITLTEPQLMAANIDSCIVSMIPRTTNVLQTTFKDNPKLAEKFIDVALEENNFFLGPILMGYFDKAMVKLNHIKAPEGSSFTSMNTKEFAKANKETLLSFDKINQQDRRRIVFEIWDQLRYDLELDQPAVINGMTTFYRFRDKLAKIYRKAQTNSSSTDEISEWAKSQAQLKTEIDRRAADVVKLRALLKEILAYPGGRDLILAFINEGLPIHARLLADLQIKTNQKQGKFLNANFVSSTAAFSASMGTAGYFLTGASLTVDLTVMAVLSAAYGAANIRPFLMRRSAQGKAKLVEEKQREVSTLLVNEARKVLNNSGLSVHGKRNNESGQLIVEDLYLEKLPYPINEELISSDKPFELSVPIEYDSVKSFAQTEIDLAKSILSDAEILNFSYLSGVPFMLDSKSLKKDDLIRRLNFRIQEIHDVLEYIRSITVPSEKLIDRIGGAIEFLDENVDPYATNDLKTRDSISEVLDFQKGVLNSTKESLVVEMTKLQELSADIVKENSHINRLIVQLEANQDGMDLKDPYVHFLEEKKNANVDAFIKGVEIAELVPDGNNKAVDFIPVEVKNDSAETQLRSKLETTHSARSHFLENSMKQAKQILGRKLEMRYLENIIFHANKFGVTLEFALKWFKTLDQSRTQIGDKKATLKDDTLIQLLPLMKLKDRVSPTEIIKTLFQAQNLIKQKRNGMKLNDAAAASLTVSSYVYDMNVDDIINRYIHLVEDLRKQNGGNQLHHIDYAGLIRLILEYPQVSAKKIIRTGDMIFDYLRKIDVPFEDVTLIGLIEETFKVTQGQFPNQDTVVQIVDSFDSYRLRFDSMGISDSQALKILAMARIFNKDRAIVKEFLESVNIYTNNDLRLGIDVLEIVLAQFANSNKITISASDVLPALAMLENNGHEMLFDEYAHMYTYKDGE